MSQNSRKEMSREDAVRIARYHALTSTEQHDYLPTTPTEADYFRPHEWVIQAIIEASRVEY